MFPLRVALRFLRTSPVQSLLIAAGITVGIGVNVFLGSLITSLQANLIEQTIGSAPHITVQAAKQGDAVVLTDAMRTVLTGDPRVTAFAPVRLAPVVFTNGTDSASLRITGGDLVRLNGIYKLSSRTVEGAARLGSGDIMVGTTFARKYGLSPGSPVVLRLPGGARAKLRVSGVFDLGAAAINDAVAFTSASFAGSAAGYLGDKYSAIQLQVAEPFASDAIAADWRSRPAFAGVQVVDWQSQNEDLLQALRSQGGSSAMIQIFVLLAVAIGIASTLAISATQKSRQIGILKAMGMADAAAGLIFLWEAAIVGAVGTAAGVAAGLGLIALFRAAAPGIFPIVPEPRFIAIACAVGIAVALVSALIPARRTSRVDPIEVVQSG